MILNRTRLAEMFGVTQKTITDWEKMGMPCLEKNTTRQGNRYSTVDCIAWRFNQLHDTGDYDLTVERARKEKESADKLQMENQVTRGELVEIADVEKLWSSEFARIKNKLLAIPKKLAPLMVPIKKQGEAHDILTAVCYEALNELSEPEDHVE